MTAPPYGLRPEQAVAVSLKLSESRVALTEAAAALRRFPGPGKNLRARHADELDAAAQMIRQWVEEGEPNGYA